MIGLDVNAIQCKEDIPFVMSHLQINEKKTPLFLDRGIHIPASFLALIKVSVVLTCETWGDLF